jgi:phosphatidylinositol alpha-1,6-mannosyltransferase
MKALLLARDFPPLGGGIARWMEQLARRYPAGDLVVSTGIVPNARPGEPLGGAPVDRVPVPDDRLRTFVGAARWSLRAAALARRHQARFVWCDTLRPTGYVAGYVRRTRRVPVGVFLHGDDMLRLAERTRRSAGKRLLAHLLFAQADLLVANSRWTAGAAAALLGELGLPERGRIVVVPLGSDPAVFHPGAPSPALLDRFGLTGRRWVLTVARLVPHKGIDAGIEAIRLLPDVHYLVVGEGPDRDRLTRLARDRGVAERVRLAGAVSDADLSTIYRSADGYLGLSREDGLDVEGFGIAIADAAASGLPIVASRDGGIVEIVEDGVNGWLVDPRDPAAVASAIAALLADRERAARLGAAGRRRVETYLNWDRVVADLVTLASTTAAGRR